jgi:polyhydroxyalkanoate synthesis regulator phasin
MRKPNPIHALTKDVASLKGKLNTLTKKVRVLSDILHGRPGLNEGQAKEVLDALQAHVNKLKGVGE